MGGGSSEGGTKKQWEHMKTNVFAYKTNENKENQRTNNNACIKTKEIKKTKLGRSMLPPKLDRSSSAFLVLFFLYFAIGGRCANYTQSWRRKGVNICFTDRSWVVRILIRSFRTHIKNPEMPNMTNVIFIFCKCVANFEHEFNSSVALIQSHRVCFGNSGL